MGEKKMTVSLPIYPSYAFWAKARVGNDIKAFESKSNNSGESEISIYANGWFHQFHLTVLDTSVNLHFGYQCSFKDPQGVHTSEMYYLGQQCPPDVVQGYIRGIRLMLLGDDKDKYTLSFNGTVCYKGSNNPCTPTAPNLPSGSWCGSETGGNDEWLSRLKITLRRA